MLSVFQGRLIIVRIILLVAMLGLISIGIASIYASGHPAGVDEHVRGASLWKKQLVLACVGLFAFFLLNLIDYRWMGPLSFWMYAACLCVLAFILVCKYGNILPSIVPCRNYAYRWINIGFGGFKQQIQPSELCKILYILALAWYLRFRKNYRHFRGLVGPFALTILAMGLIIKEPDLGTTLLLMPILFAMLFVAGAKVKHLLIIILMGASVSPMLWGKLDMYQRSRISSFLLQSEKVREKVKKDTDFSELLTGREHFSESRWKQYSGYHLIHSKRAIASGGLTGYGFRKGPYIKYPQLPERHNDFIFAIIAHQWGLVGCLVVFLLYAVIVACGMEIAWNNTDPFARLIAVGILTMLMVQVIVNTCMTVGLMPITGLTLPLVSYGGSSLIVNIMAIGILNNIGRARPFTVAGKGFEGS